MKSAAEHNAELITNYEEELQVTYTTVLTLQGRIQNFEKGGGFD